VLDEVCAAAGVVERVVERVVIGVVVGEGAGAAEVVGAGATSVEVVGAGAGAALPQSQDMENRPTLVGSKYSKRP